MGHELENVTLNDKGKATIPLRIRKGKGLKRSIKAALIETRERIEPVVMLKDPVQGLTGLGKKFPSFPGSLRERGLTQKRTIKPTSRFYKEVRITVGASVHCQRLERNTAM